MRNRVEGQVPYLLSALQRPPVISSNPLGTTWPAAHSSHGRLKPTRLSLSCTTWHDCSSPARFPQTSNPTVGIMRIDRIPAAVCPSGHSTRGGHSRTFTIVRSQPAIQSPVREARPPRAMVRIQPKRWSDHCQSAAHIKSAGGVVVSGLCVPLIPTHWPLHRHACTYGAHI